MHRESGDSGCGQKCAPICTSTSLLPSLPSRDAGEIFDNLGEKTLECKSLESTADCSIMFALVEAPLRAHQFEGLGIRVLFGRWPQEAGAGGVEVR